MNPNTSASGLDLTGQVTITEPMPVFMGNYSCVFRGDLHGATVAIKVIKGTNNLHDMKRKVLRERMVWATINHTNIHPFYGYADDQVFGPFGALVSPWCVRGDAARFLVENGGRVTVNERILLWKGVVNGVTYLHGHTPTIVHGDLKPGNVLIDESGQPRLCDFGLARIFLEEGNTGMTTTSEHTGTSRYLAPELIASEHSVHPTTASDVYALGCLGLEIVLLQLPYSNRANNMRGQIFRDIKAGVPPAVSPPKGEWVACRIWPLLLELWNIDPTFRPSAFSAAQTLKRTELTLPLLAFRKIAEFASMNHNAMDRQIERSAWKQRTKLLHDLALVSRTCWAIVNPILYRDIRLYLNHRPQKLPELLRTLESSRSNPLTILSFTPNGYGNHIRTILLRITSGHARGQGFIYGYVSTLVEECPAVQFILIRGARDILEAKAHPSLTFEFQNVGIGLILQRSILQSLGSMQRLSIRHCDTLRPEPGLLARRSALLPSLIEINLEVDNDTSVAFQLLPLFSAWSMPRLRAFHYTSQSPSTEIDESLLRFFAIHGHKLQYLSANITDVTLISTLLSCGSLRSVTLWGCSMHTMRNVLRHSSLETVSLHMNGLLGGDLYVHLGIMSPDTASGLHEVWRFRENARTMLPNLANARLIFDDPEYEIDLANPLTVSFRTMDDYIMVKVGDKVVEHRS